MNSKLKICSVCGLPSVLWRSSPALCKNCDQRRRNSLKQTMDGLIAKPVKVYQTKQIKKVSDKQKRLNLAYLAQRQVYLKQHPFCKVGIEGCMGKATQVHHMRGRIGELMLDENFWLPVCAFCHNHVETHCEWAKEMGFSESRLNTTI